MNAVDPTGLETDGWGVFANGTAFFRQIGGDIKYVKDDKGNQGISITGSIGASTDPFGAAAGATYEHTNAKDIQQTAGEAASGGATVSLGGAVAGLDKVKGEGYDGYEARAGMAAGLPLEASTSRDFTYIIPLPDF